MTTEVTRGNWAWELKKYPYIFVHKQIETLIYKFWRKKKSHRGAMTVITISYSTVCWGDLCTAIGYSEFPQNLLNTCEIKIMRLLVILHSGEAYSPHKSQSSCCCFSAGKCSHFSFVRTQNLLCLADPGWIHHADCHIACYVEMD